MDFQKRIEWELALELYKKLYYQEVDKKRIAEIAKYIVKLIPEKTDIEELKKTLTKLVNSCPEIASVCLKYYNQIEKEISIQKIKSVKQKIESILNAGTNITDRSTNTKTNSS